MWAYDISRMGAGAMFMLGAGYALSKGVHIRADFMYRDWSVKTQAIIDLTLILYYFIFLGLLVQHGRATSMPINLGQSWKEEWILPGCLTCIQLSLPYLSDLFSS